MPKITRRTALAGLAALPAMPAWAGNTPFLGAGINVHHPMGWPLLSPQGSYIWPPFSGTHYQTPASTIAALKAAGFSWIRFQMDVGILLASSNDRRKYLLSLALEKTRPFLDSGLKVVYDLQTNLSNPVYNPNRLFQDSAEFSSLVALVGQVAQSLTNVPPNKVILELINEPTMRGDEGVRTWQGMLEVLHKSARKSSQNLPIVLTGCNYSGFSELTRIDPRPFRGSNVFYTFHYYDPHIFTHQGIDAAGDVSSKIDNLRWPPEVSDRDRLTKLYPSSNWLTGAFGMNISNKTLGYLVEQYFAGSEGLRKPAQDFASVAKWATQHSIPKDRIFLGEFGARAVSQHPELRRSRLAYIRQVRRAAELFGFSWAYFDLRGGGNWNLLKDGTDADLDKGVLQALGLHV